MAVDVSVVVPVYNTERYLKECIESLIHQTLLKVEFIFVDDGSTDRSVNLIEEYQKKDQRIQLIKQENQGAGVARNNGMREAKGKYIIFLDSDDFFALDMLEEAFLCAEQNQTEIIAFGYYMLNNLDGAVRKAKEPSFPSGVFSMKDIGELFFDSYISAPWNKLFLKSFIEENKLSYQALKKCNDVYFTHMAAYLAKRIVFLKKSLVYYRVNNRNSLQGNMNNDRSIFVDFEKAIKKELTERNIFTGIYKMAFYRHLKDTIHFYGGMDWAEIESYRDYFFRLKEELVPGLFDSVFDFEDDSFIRQIYEGTFEDVLFQQAVYSTEQFKKQEEYSRSLVKSKDYRVGHVVLFLPRLITHVMKRLRGTTKIHPI